MLHPFDASTKPTLSYLHDVHYVIINMAGTKLPTLTYLLLIAMAIIRPTQASADSGKQASINIVSEPCTIVDLGSTC